MAAIGRRKRRKRFLAFILVVAINNTANDIGESFTFENYQIETVYYGEVDKNTQKALLKRSAAVVFSIKAKA